MVAVLHVSAFFLESQLVIKKEMFCHQVIGVQANLIQLLFSGLLFNKCHESPSQPLSLTAWIHGDILDKHVPALWHHPQHPSNRFFICKHRDHSLCDESFVIGEHWCRLLPDPFDRRAVGCLNASYKSFLIFLLGLPNDVIQMLPSFSAIRHRATGAGEGEEIRPVHPSCV